jgi:hypothetical protein
MESDDWGFTDADHAEFDRLMKKYEARVPDIMHDVLVQDGIVPMPEDDGMMGEFARMVPNDEMHITRVFHKGGMWLTLLDRLRELDAKESGAQ